MYSFHVTKNKSTGSSKSYASRLKEKQEQLAAAAELETPAAYRRPQSVRKSHKNSLLAAPDTFEKVFQQALNHSHLSPPKRPVNSDRKFKSPEESLLENIRSAAPKAELQVHERSLFSSRNSSWEQKGQVELEEKLRVYRGKYRKLEGKYRDLLARFNRSEQLYENALQKLTDEITLLKIGQVAVAPSKENIQVIFEEVNSIRKRLAGIEQATTALEDI